MKKNLFFAISLLMFIALIPAVSAYAGEENDKSNYLPGYEAVRYGKSDGLPSVEVNAITQTEEGYLWIGTYSGLYRYDGSVFEKMSPDQRVSSVMMLFADSRGWLWIGTNDSGVAYYVPAEAKTYVCSKADGLPSDSIRAFAEDSKGNVFIGTVEGLSIMTYYGKVVNPSSFSALGSIRALVSGGDYIVGVTGSGMLFVADENGVLRTAFSDTSGVDFTSVAVNGDGLIVAGTSASYVQMFLYNDGELMSFSHFDGKELNYYSYVYFDEAGYRWFLCAENGMGVLDGNSGKFTNLTHTGFESSVCQALCDYQGNIWFVSNKKGLLKFSPTPFTDVFAKSGIPANVVNCIATKGNDIYIGKDDGLYVIDSTTYEKRDYHFTDAFKGIRIRHISCDSHGNMWISTYGKEGLYKIENDGTIKTFNEKNGTIGGRFRFAMELSDGSVIAASNLGLTFIKDDTIINTLDRYDGLDTPQILTIVENFDGTVYAGSDGGGVYVIKNGVIIDCIDENDGLESLVVLRIVPYNNGFFYVTSNALYYDNGKEIKRLTAFPYTNNYDIYINDEKKAWIFSSAGIYIANASDIIENGDYMYTLLDESMGFNTSLTANAWNLTDGGSKLLLCCTDGVREVDMNSYDYFDRKCHIEVKYILADGVEIIPGTDGIYTIPATRGRIQIAPAILNFTLSNPQVRMYLENSNDTGVSGRKNAVSELVYTNLPYGRYKLHVQIIDGMDYSIARDEVFEIYKKPRFFEHISVRIASVLLAMGVAALIVLWVLKATIIRRQYEQIRLAKDEAERANSAKSRFLANMSHEIRTPINTIMGMDEMILREDRENVPTEYARSVTGYAMDIKHASETLLGLVNDVLDLSKIESGKMNLVEQEYDTNDLLRSIVTMIRVRSNQKDLTFETRIDPALPKKLYGDMGKIKQVVLNLLTNAVKYTQKGGFVLNVEVKEKDEKHCSIYFAVKDTGIGVKKEDMSKLFSAFERLDEKKNSGIQGTGLGLDISRQFVALMGGDLCCESEYGVGSTFYFIIRQEIVDVEEIGTFSEKGEEHTGAYVPQFVASNARVLVVDDNSMNLLVLKGLLKGTRVKVFTAMSGKECIEALKKDSFDVVLLDHMMPEMDGLETLKHIREDIPERSEVPIIALTANGATDGGSFYKQAGFSDYLAKPVDGDVLERTLKQYIPKELLEDPGTADVTENADRLPEEYSWLEEVEGISVKDGIRYCGGAESFVKSIKTFYDMLPENSEIIEKTCTDGDIELYTVKVHALKSSARIIGAADLSKLAENLEEAGKREDKAFIADNTNELLALYNSYKGRLERFSENENGTEIDPEELKEAYEALKEFVPQMDYDSIEMMLAEVMPHKLPEKDGEFFRKISVLLKKLDWDEMEKMINEI